MKTLPEHRLNVRKKKKKNRKNNFGKTAGPKPTISSLVTNVKDSNSKVNTSIDNTPLNNIKNIAARSPPGSPKVQRKPIYNKEGKMVFSKFDFLDSGSKKKKDTLAGHDYKRLIQKVEKQKEKLKNLQKVDTVQAQKAEEQQAWLTALQRAEGIKVKDNTELLKKSLKQKEKRKLQKKSAWQDREQNVEKQMQKKQDKRKRNLKKRMDSKKEKKMKRAKKKGRLIPGF